MKSSTFAQHELNMNVFNVIVFKAPNISYEYLANENMSFGLGFLYRIDRGEAMTLGIFSYDMLFRKYSITPFIRRYFSRKYARGFFIEGFGMLNSGDIAKIRNLNDFQVLQGVNEIEVVTYRHFAGGITFGGKFLIGNKGVTCETHFGFGWNFLFGENSSGLGAVSRGGVSMGYRF
ncbi:DUF3575 domain-containing protein [Maribacter algarum]|uniref:DUF3575 domain-containing protein n=1 Tax=Maribacter algarum (ex Zhang et al. 2020) TaxID=2578118 RepID=A0A5S3PVT4_9FLAO|nr:DUF3575 domain-containing protein [Maribacter algarum]TMM59040.1 DUF3575 domain-containing protein [Maribacter algarum]